MLFPFLTSMYVARVILPADIGEIAYAQNIVSYFSILAFLGIPTYGVREIAKVRNSKNELSTVFSELFLINLISSVIFSLAYYTLIFITPSFREHIALYSIMGITVILNMLNISWLYEGLEEFGFISLRNAVFKLIMFMLVVYSVRSRQDVLRYVAITVLCLSEAGNNIINVVHANRYLRFQRKNLNLVRHLRSIFILAAVNLAIEIYTLIDTTMLGIISAKENVAFYYYASKINKILLQITNTVTMVLVPRISLYYKEHKMNEFNQLLTKTLKIIIITSVPMIIGLQFTSDFLFSHFFGSSYTVSAAVERILCFVLAISPVGYLLGSRVMLVSNNESKMTICVGTGAIVNIVGNYFLIQKYNEFGAAIASVISESIVMLMYIYQGKKVFRLYEFKTTILKVIIAGICEIAVLLFCNQILYESWEKILIEIIAAGCVYIALLILSGESVTKEYISRILNRLLSKT